jgi:putative endonuclease
VVGVVDRARLGQWGEDVAVQHLEATGYEVLARNWRCKDGEIDIIARTGEVLCFVEVKTRSSLAFGEPAEAVKGRKMRRQPVLAAQYLRDQRPTGWGDLRYDVVSVLRQQGQPPEVVHIEGIF